MNDSDGTTTSSPGTDAGEQQREVEAGRAARHGDRVDGTGEGCERRLELAHAGSLGHPPGGDGGRGRLGLLVAEQRLHDGNHGVDP